MLVKKKKGSKARSLDKDSALYFRDKLREARYLALADSEGFPQICYAIESLGRYLTGKGHGLGDYYLALETIVHNSGYSSEIVSKKIGLFAEFGALYATLKAARNDVMHSGVYARHATEAGINLCLMLEEALFVNIKRKNVSDFMIRNPVFVESWHPVAFARQLMLTHSFSFLPVQIGTEWKLLSELEMATYLFPHDGATRLEYLNKSIADAIKDDEGEFRLKLEKAVSFSLDCEVSSVLENRKSSHSLWLVLDGERLLGVLSPFELM